jgi:hypothetical protein
VRLTVILCAFAAYAQTPSSQPPAAGLEPAWDIAVVVQEIGAHSGRLLPVLNRLDASGWVAKGASDTYVEQLDSCRQQARALVDEAAALSRNPEKLSGALHLFFRLQGLETMIYSVQEGARKYQGPQISQELGALFAEGGANRDRLRSYIVNLASERDRQFEVMDREAQRCRATLMAPTPPPKTSGRKK